MAPALMVGWIEGGAGFFLFSVLLAAPLSYRVDRGRHLASSTFVGWLGMAPALMVGWIEGGAGFFLFSVLPGGAVELPGRSRPAPGVVDLRGVARDGARADGGLDRGRRRLFSF